MHRAVPVTQTKTPRAAGCVPHNFRQLNTWLRIQPVTPRNIGDRRAGTKRFLDNPSLLLQRPRTARRLHPVARHRRARPLRQCTQPSRPILRTPAKCPLLLDGHLPILTMTTRRVPHFVSTTVGGHSAHAHTQNMAGNKLKRNTWRDLPSDSPHRHQMPEIAARYSEGQSGGSDRPA